LAIEVHRQIKSELGIKGLSIADIFRQPTLGGLHGVIQRLAGGGAKPRKAPREAGPRESEPAVVSAEAAARPVMNEGVVSRRRALRAGRSADQ
jgi:hypothetical protein